MKIGIKQDLSKSLVSRVRNMIPLGKSKTTMRHGSRSMRCEKLEARQLFAADSFVGMFDAGRWSLSDNPAQQMSFGLPGDQPVVGDWNGDGRETPGVYRNGTWVLDLTGNGFDAGDLVLQFGLPGDKAVAGDWDGDGVDTVGVFRDGAWFIDRNGNGYDAADVNPVFFGWGSDTPVPGDWNGDGKDTPGIYRAGTWALDLTGNGFDAGDRFLQFGLPGDQPVSGDWNKDGKDTPGVLQNNRWFFDLEGNGYTGEVGTPNRLGAGGIAVAGETSIGPRPTVPVFNGEVGVPGTSRPPATGGSASPSTPNTPSVPSTPSVPTTPTPPPAPVLSPEVDVVGITDGQVTSISFGNVNVGQVTTRTFTVRNLGNAALTLGQLQVTSGFTILNGLPRSLAPNASATFRIGMTTSTAGTRSGTLSFVTNDLDESVYNFNINGSVTAPVTSNFGSVVSFQTTVGTSGSIVLKTVRNYNATGNNLRLYADFLSPSGVSIRTDVLIGNPNSSFGDQTTPQVSSLDLGRYVIAWRSTSLSGRNDIHYSMLDAYGAVVGNSDRIANIGYSTNLELKSVSKQSNGFRLNWLDLSNNRSIRRHFNMVGVATTGEIRN